MRRPSAQGRTAPPVERLVLLGDVAALLLALLAAPMATGILRARLLPAGGPVPLAEAPGTQQGLLYVLGLALCLWFAAKGHYTARHPFSLEVKHILIGVAAAALVNGYLQFALKAETSRLWLTQTWLLALVLLVLMRAAVKGALFKLGPWRLPTVVIGSPARIADVEALLAEDRYLGYDVQATLPLASDADDPRPALDRLIAAGPVRYAVIAFDDEKVKETHAAARLVDHHYRIPHGIVPPLKGISLVDLEVQKFLGHDLVLLANHRRARSSRRRGKRLFDLLGAAFLLLLLAPLMLLLAFLVRRDGGPALYGSPRLGRGGEVFRAWKFRSMVPDAERALQEMLAQDPALRREWEGSFKLKDDPRITRIGRFLRESSLDELPQLLNVLKGEMSLVGPRPLLLDERASYGGDAFALYSEATPGMTGMWQVSGRDALAYARRIELNNWYIKNWSPWNDLVILAKTLFVVVRRLGVS